MSDSGRNDSGRTVLLDFTPREIPPAERVQVQAILDRDFRGYRLVEAIEPPTTIVSALRDRGFSPTEVARYLTEHDPWKVTVPAMDISPSWSEVCHHYAPDSKSRPQDDEASTGDDAEPDVGPDLRLYRVRGIGDPEDLNRGPERSFPVIVSLQTGRVIAIN